MKKMMEDNLDQELVIEDTMNVHKGKRKQIINYRQYPAATVSEGCRLAVWSKSVPALVHLERYFESMDPGSDPGSH